MAKRIAEKCGVGGRRELGGFGGEEQQPNLFVGQGAVSGSWSLESDGNLSGS